MKTEWSTEGGRHNLLPISSIAICNKLILLHSVVFVAVIHNNFFLFNPVLNKF